MHNWGVLVTLVPNLPGETVVRRLSVGGLLACTCGGPGLLLFLLWAPMTIMLGRQAELAHMDPAAISAAGIVLAVVGTIADLPPIGSGGVNEASP